MKAYDLMSSPLSFVRARDSVREVARLFARKRLREAPVLDGLGRPIGVVTQLDLARYEQECIDWIHGHGRTAGKPRFHLEPENEPVEAWITPEIPIVRADASLSEVVREMLRRRTDYVFVAERDERLGGVITAMGVLRRLGKRRRSPSPKRAPSGERALKEVPWRG